MEKRAKERGACSDTPAHPAFNGFIARRTLYCDNGKESSPRCSPDPQLYFDSASNKHAVLAVTR